MQIPFVPTAGRIKLLDWLKHRFHRYLPAWCIACIRAFLRPFVLIEVWFNHRLQVRKFLPSPLSSQFLKMYRQARNRWDQGQRCATGDPVKLPIGHSNYSVWVRPGTCDVILYSAILVHEQYGRAPLKNPRTIIDCGANIGFATAYFLWKNPEAHVIALEPDPINYNLCKKNVQQFGKRITLVNGAVWGSAGPMRVKGDNLGTWASTVVPARDGTISSETIEGFDMPTLFDRYDIRTVDILKMDIEGAEFEIFTAENLDWISRVRCFQIELEDDKCKQAFFRALANWPFRFLRHSEVTIAYREDL